MYTSPFRLSGVTVVPFSDIFPARNSTRYLLEEPREPGTRLGNRAPEVVILEERPASKPGQDHESPSFLVQCDTGGTERKAATRPGERGPPAAAQSPWSAQPAGAGARPQLLLRFLHDRN